jgi:hypothetical protein
MPPGLGPPHDHVRLSSTERHVIASLELQLAEEQRAATGLSAWLRRSAPALGRPLFRVAPRLLPLAFVLTLAASSRSAVVGALSALVTGLLLVMTCWRIVLGATRRRAQREARRRNLP